MVSMSIGDGTLREGLKLQHRKFRLEIKKHSLIMTVVKHENRLPREVAGSPHLVYIEFFSLGLLNMDDPALGR